MTLMVVRIEPSRQEFTKTQASAFNVSSEIRSGRKSPNGARYARLVAIHRT